MGKRTDQNLLHNQESKRENPKETRTNTEKATKKLKTLKDNVATYTCLV